MSESGTAFRETYVKLRVGDGQPSARGLRIRLDTTSATGPHWLTCLAVCGWLRGVVDVPEWAMVPD